MSVNSKTFDQIKPILLKRIKEEEENKFPQTVLIDNISFCNLKCSMCPHRFMKRKQGIMQLDLYKKIIDEIADKKPEARVWITFCGEGLILKDLHDRVRYAKEKGLKDVVLNTNGNLLDASNSEKLIKAGLDTIYVGIDAFNEETYKKVRVGGDMKKVINGVKTYKKLLEKIGTKGQNIYVQMVEMEENQKEVKEFTSFWSEKGINVKIRPKVSWSGKVNGSSVKNFDERLPCFWAMNTINIVDDGRVCLCSVDLECETVFGDLNNQTIEEIWNSTHKLFRECHLKGKWNDIPEMCIKCNDWQMAYSDFTINKE